MRPATNGAFGAETGGQGSGLDGFGAEMNKSKAFSLSLRVAAMVGAGLALLSQAPPARSATPLALQAAPVVTVPGLAAYWPFDSASGGVSPDMSGNANDGTLTSGPTI